MKVASIQDIKSELANTPHQGLVDICLRLAKYKLDNKELISYLLFEANDEVGYTKLVKQQIEEDFKGLNKRSHFLAKKTIRKALRTANKHSKYSGNKQTELELLIHFSKQLRTSGLTLRANTVIGNIYQRQLLKIKKILSGLHEDLQYDYHDEVEMLGK